MSLEDKRDDFFTEIVANEKPSSPSAQPTSTRLVEIAPSSQTASCDEDVTQNDNVISANKPKKIDRPFNDSQEGEEKESKVASEIADILKNDLVYDEIGGDWYSQKNGLWSVISEKRALEKIMWVLDRKQPKGYGISKLNNIKSFLMIYLLLEKWASNRHLLPMANGVLDIETLKLMPYSHEHRFSWQLPYPYDADAKIEVIKRWLWDASGHDLESINIIRAFFKMALIGGDVQKFLELIGGGGTGKSTLTRLLVAFIGEKNHTVTELKALETNRFEAAGLYGKRLVLINDSSRYGGEVSVLKALTGGDPIRLEKKNVQQSGSFVFDGVVVIASNEAIQTADYTSGLIRRRMPVNFNRKVTDADKLKWKEAGGIEAVMHRELDGLLNWVLAMSDSEVKQAIGGINGEMTQAQREHLIETNKIAAWIDDNLIINSKSVLYVGKSMKKQTDFNEINTARREKLYSNYEAWCDDYAVHPVAIQRFTNNILDVCGQLKMDVADLDRNRNGKRIRGLEIRKDHHVTDATPITKKLLCDEEKILCDENVTKQSRASVDVTKCADINSVTENILFDDSEVI